MRWYRKIPDLSVRDFILPYRFMWWPAVIWEKESLGWAGKERVVWLDWVYVYAPPHHPAGDAGPKTYFFTQDDAISWADENGK